jgi:hypothetical protein
VTSVADAREDGMVREAIARVATGAVMQVKVRRVVLLENLHPLFVVGLAEVVALLLRLRLVRSVESQVECDGHMKWQLHQQTRASGWKALLHRSRVQQQAITTQQFIC